jgi:hypothetical protein
MQVVSGASRIVRVSHDGKVITPLTVTTMDTLWSEPRWSHAGDRIVAVRWFRGGVSQIVVIDTLGAVLHVATSGLFTAAAPSWIPSDSGVVYTLGDNARNDIYLQYFRGTHPYRTETFKVARTDFGAFEPQLTTAGSSRDEWIAAVELRARGYHLAVTDRTSAGTRLEPVTPSLDVRPDPRLPPLAIDSTPATSFSAFRTLVPRFWVPLIESGLGDGTYRVGGYTQGWDILRRHQVYGEVRAPTDNSGVDALVAYDYSGLGMPILTADVSQDWTNYADIVSSANPTLLLGMVRRRIRDGELLATITRPRARTFFSVSAGAGFERREYLSVPDTLLPKLDTAHDFDKADFPRLMASTSFAAYQSAPFSISR